MKYRTLRLYNNRANIKGLYDHNKVMKLISLQSIDLLTLAWKDIRAIIKAYNNGIGYLPMYHLKWEECILDAFILGTIYGKKYARVKDPKKMKFKRTE